MGQNWRSPGSKTGMEIVAVVEEYSDSPRTCTLFPANASENGRTSMWISAEEGSFVSVENVR